ncbi:MAG TPA: hypothetical protein VML58_23165, partial [Burkholderiaceae bacterium]|nr:hypothetical protein [Burkholderiaceae bacterium]
MLSAENCHGDVTPQQRRRVGDRKRWSAGTPGTHISVPPLQTFRSRSVGSFEMCGATIASPSPPYMSNTVEETRARR